MPVTPIEARCRRCGDDFHLFEVRDHRRGTCPRCGWILTPDWTAKLLEDAARADIAQRHLVGALRSLRNLPGNVAVRPHTVLRNLFEGVGWQRDLVRIRGSCARSSASCAASWRHGNGSSPQPPVPHPSPAGSAERREPPPDAAPGPRRLPPDRMTHERGSTMPLFVAALVVARRRRTATVPVPVPVPLWWLLVDELIAALRSAWARVAGRR